MNEKILTQAHKFTCVECKNEVTVEDVEIGEIVECPYCGIEFEILGKEGDEYTLQMLEEEK